MKVGIFYFTTSGNTQEMAEALKEGFESKGAEVLLEAMEDASSSSLESLDLVALGTPAQGSEEVDESTFQPFYDENKEALEGKPLLFFGSYGWGGGEYLEEFAKNAKEEGLEVAAVFTHLEAPDEECKEMLQQKAADLVK